MKQNKETVLVLVKVSNETIRTMTNLGYPKFKSKIYDILTYCIDKEDKKRKRFLELLLIIDSINNNKHIWFNSTKSKKP